ncbi:MAG: DNA cytosine methyltransferase [Bryobacteraceae bacterium]|jgi:DNA (cytosine-5)-methyltransferase 1
MGRSARLTSVDLFAGAGGMSLGFQAAGFDVLAAVEYDPIHAAIHEFNFPDCATICRSVADIDGEYIRAHSQAGGSDIDVVFGGAPCQGFSLIGKRAFDDPRNHLVYHFVRLVTELRPKFFVFENVKGLTLGEHRQFLHQIIEEFKGLGYKVESRYRVLNAANYGVPQDRQRLFLLGSRRGMPLPGYPVETHSPETLLPGLCSATPTVWDALGDLPEADRFEELLERDWVLAEFGKPSAYAAPLRSSGSGQNGSELLTSSLRTVHTPLSQRRFRATPQGAVEPVSRFLRLDPKGICNTIRAGTASDHGAFTSPRPIHPFSPRCITVREAARLHSYPDWFRFHVTKWHGFRQIGNSVPPLLAKAVASKIAEELTAKPLGYFPRRLGDPALLSLNMSEAAERYGVSAGVIPQRRRKAPEKVYA